MISPHASFGSSARACRTVASTRSAPRWTESGPGWAATGLFSGIELVGEQIHQQAVVPGPVEVALVLAHDADRPKADACVGPDRPLVVRRGVDRQTVVAAFPDQPPSNGPNRIRAKPAALRGLDQNDVDAGVAVASIGFLVRLDDADHDVLGFDRPDREVVLATGQLRSVP